MPNHLKYNKNFEKISYEEKQLLEEAKKSIVDYVENSAVISDVDYATRNAHAKTYALAKGKFTIGKEIPEEIMYLFDNSKYEITARWSNAHFKIKKRGKIFPLYGFSIKIKDNLGKTISNYPLVNFPLLPVPSVAVLLKLFIAVNKIYLKKYRYYRLFIGQIIKITPLIFSTAFIKKFYHLVLTRRNFILSHDFYSVGAYRLDDKMIKLKISPKITEKKSLESSTSSQIEQYILNNGYRADVYIQFCNNLKDQPINNLHQEWQNAPFIKIGELEFEKNSLMNPKSCENELLSFNPFDSAEIFKPVGKIQKIREEAYKTSLQTRKKINKLLKYK